MTNAGTPTGGVTYVVPTVNITQTRNYIRSGSTFTITITGGGITGSVVYQAFADTKAELVTALQGAVDANSGVHTYNTTADGFEFISEVMAAYGDVNISVASETGDIVFTTTTKYEGYN